ncbi:MAG: DNA topoisomerase III [Mariniblastus sp.]|nr:DNA topoisomerase III [Mariniblastus sp.]
MPKTLIIAEKPSVATDLARVLGKIPELGKFQKKKDFFENEHAYISSAVGHLVELKMPEGPNGKKLPWGMKHLPIIPPKFELQPIERSLARYKVLLRLLKKKDIETVVNACDAGREGELIFRYLLQMANLNKPFNVRRMWMQSMTDDAILKAWTGMRSNDEMLPLADAALCRSESDWLIGLNGTRALTAFNSRNGGFNVTTAGRVQTPTLCILAERERIIRAFKPRTYWEVHGDFSVQNGDYPGRWFKEDFTKDENDNQLKAERIWTLDEAEAIRARCLGKVGTVEEEKKPSKQAPPLLFDLTSLQREAGNKHGFSASRTLQLAQACYDRYKLLTYPRTDSKCLPEDYLSTVVNTVKNLAKAKPNDSVPSALASCAQWIVDNKRVIPSKRIFNDKKVSDHFAIIPTGKTPPSKLDETAAKIYALVVRRFLAVFYPHAEFEITRRITRIGEDTFRTDGRILVNPGYLEVYGRKAGAPADKDDLVAVTDGEEATASDIEIKTDETRPPARYNDSTLLSAMETAGRRVDDEELRDAMSERGLGTPATRAAIIENLIRQKYLFRDDRNKRDLVVSNKGLAMTDLLHDIGIATLGSAEMTGEWEYKLKQMELGQLDRETFMNEIKTMTKSLVEQTRGYTEEIVNRPFPDLLAPCPACESNVHKQTDGVFDCYNPECSFRLKKHIASHELTEDEAKTLMSEGRVGPIETFKNRFGQPFAAELTIGKKKRTWKVEFIFEGDDLREEELKSLNDDKLLCEAPKGDGTAETLKVYETERAFLAPQMATKVDERGVRISKTILQKEIPSEQAKKLFAEGKTDLMPGFISKKNRRFSAHLTLDPTTGKLGFEFAPRKNAKKKESGSADGATEGADEKALKKKATKKKATKKKATKKKATKKKATKKTEPKKSAD